MAVPMLPRMAMPSAPPNSAQVSEIAEAAPARGWILSSQAATGELRYERNVDVQDGDMLWDAAALNDGRLLAVGSTNYTQNPSGLSVSDTRDSLALILDSLGNVQKRIALPAGPRGNEAMSVGVDVRRQIAISGVPNAPGTPAAVYSDAFLVVRAPDLF